MQDEIKKFDTSTRCIKCDFFHSASAKWNQEKDVIVRICIRCGYYWYELPLDKVNAPKNSSVRKETELDRQKTANKLR